MTLLQHQPTMDNLINYKQLTYRARQDLRDSKKSSWRAYIFSLINHTSSRDVWHKVRKIKGTCSPCTISGLLFMVLLNQCQVILSTNWHLILPVCLVLIIIVQLFSLLRRRRKARSLISVLPFPMIIIYPSLILNYSLLSPVHIIVLQGQITSITQC